MTKIIRRQRQFLPAPKGTGFPCRIQMKVIEIDARTFLVEWKYKDFLRVGHLFQGATIVRIERYDHFGVDYVRVAVEPSEYKI